MASYNPFQKQREEQKPPEANWFLKTATKVAAFSGTAFGVYGLWKITGPSRKILEKIIDSRMKQRIAAEQYKAGDHYSEFAEEWVSGEASLREELRRDNATFQMDTTGVWDNLNTEQTLKTKINDMESAIISRLEEDATYLSSDEAQIKRVNKRSPEPNWFALNKKGTVLRKKTVSLAGFEAEQLARLRQAAIVEYLETQGATSIEKNAAGVLQDSANAMDFFSSKEYFETDRVAEGYGKETINRVTTLHETYINDKAYSDIYYRKLKQVHSRYVLNTHTYKRPKIDKTKKIGTSAKQFLYGDIVGEVLDPSMLPKYNPVIETLFDSFNPTAKFDKEIKSMGAVEWKGNRFSVLQQTVYTGHINNLRKTLTQIKDEGHITDFSVDLVDHGTARNPDKKLVISIMHPDQKFAAKSFHIEIPIGIDGRLPGATPGLQQLAERFHIVGDAYGFGDSFRIVNTTELNLMDVSRMLQGSLISGYDSFKDSPDKFVKQINRAIGENIKQNAAATGSMYDLFNAMSIDNPALRDLIDSSRSRHATARRNATNFVSSARNTKQIVSLRKAGKSPILVNFDIETLDATNASPGKSILSKEAQITKYGIAVQDTLTGKIIDSFEESNDTGYKYFQARERVVGSGQGWTPKLLRWLRDGVLPDGKIGTEVEDYKKLLGDEGARTDLYDRQAVVKNMVAKLRSTISNLIKDGRSADEIFIGVKNGWNFDLKAIEMDAPEFLEEMFNGRKVREMIIDVQSLHAFRNNALGENNALKLERVVLAMLGRLGEDPKDFVDKGNNLKVPEIIKALKKRSLSIKGQHTTLLDWDPSEYTVHGKRMLMRAHGAPRVDAALGAALFMEQVADYTAGLDYLDAADHIAKLLKDSNGPMSPDNLTDIFRYLNEKVIDGYGVASYSASSQGMIANHIANFIHLNELSPIADPLNVGIRRRHAGTFGVGLSKHYKKKFGQSKNVYQNNLGKFMTTSTVEDATKIIVNRVAKATDAANSFSNSILAHGVYLLEAEKEPTIAVSEGLMKKYEMKQVVSVTTDALVGDSLLNAKLHEFHRQVNIVATNLAGEGHSITPDHWAAAEEEVAKKMNLTLNFDSDIVSASKYGGQVALPRRYMHGRVVGAMVEPDKTAIGKRSVQRMLYKIEYTVEGENMFKNVQLQMPGAHSVSHPNKIVADAAAAGMLGLKDLDFLASSEFLKKGHIGAAKEIMLGHLLKKLYNDVEGASDPATKRASVKLIKEISAQLKAKVNIKQNKFIVNTQDRVGEVNERVRILGDTNVTISKITEWYRTAGLVWNKTDIANLADQGYNFDLHKQYEEMFKSITKLSDKHLRGTYDGFRDLTKEELSFARQELGAVQQLFAVDANNPNSAKVFLPVPVGKRQFRLGIAAYDSISIYGSNAQEMVNRESMFRQDYYLGFKYTHHGKDKTTMDYIARHTFASRYQTYKSVMATYQNFTNTIFAEKLTKGPLDLSAIGFLTDLRQRLNLSREKLKMASTHTWGALPAGDLASALRDRNTLIEKEEKLLDINSRQTIEKEKSDILDALSKKKGGEKLFDSMSRIKGYYSTDDVMQLSELARQNNGVLAFKLPSLAGNSVEQIPIREVVRRMVGELSGEPNMTQHQIKNISEQLIATLENGLKNSKSDSPLRMVDGKLHMGALVMDFDPMPQNMFTRIESGDAWKSTDETEKKMYVLNAFHEWSKMVNTVKKDDKDYERLIDPLRDKFHRAYVNYLMTGLPADTMSKFWQAGQFNIPGEYAMVKNMDQLQRNILSLESNKPGAFKRNQTVKLLKEARFDTVVISEKAFRNFKFVNDTGEYVNAAQEMEKSIAARLGNSKAARNAVQDYSKGRRLLPGGLVYRHPIPQAGYDGLRVAQFLVVPSNVGKMIGMDDNSAYANPTYISGQGADFDGDSMFMHLKEIGVKYAQDEMRTEHDAAFQRMIQQPEMQKLLKESQIVRDSDGKIRPIRDAHGNITNRVKIGDVNNIMYTSGDTSRIATLNMQGERHYLDVSNSMLDLSNLAKHTMNLVQKAATLSPTHANSARVSSVAEANVNVLISKNIIPITTNLLKTRTRDILSNADLRKDPLKVMSFIGNLEHGLAGAAQSVIDIAKHPEKSAQLTKVLDWLTTGSSSQEAKDFYLGMRREQIGDAFDQVEEEATFDIFSGKLESIEKLKTVSAQMRMARKQTLDMYMGRKNTTLFDAVRSWSTQHFDDVAEPSRPESVIQQLNDSIGNRLGRRVDIEPFVRKGGKYAAIGASAFLGLSLFTPFGSSKSLNPVDMFVDIGAVNGNRSVLDSPLELDRSQGLSTVNASFSKEAFVKMNKSNENKDKSSVINSMLMSSMLGRGDSYYEFSDRPYRTYSNYTKGIGTIGTNELSRRYE